jgi:hypothetical protein
VTAITSNGAEAALYTFPNLFLLTEELERDGGRHKPRAKKNNYLTIFSLEHQVSDNQLMHARIATGTKRSSSPPKAQTVSFVFHKHQSLLKIQDNVKGRPGLWSYDGQAKIAFLPLQPQASYRRSALQAMYRKMEEEIENLTKQVAEQADQRTRARRRMTHLGVGPVTALRPTYFMVRQDRRDVWWAAPK